VYKNKPIFYSLGNFIFDQYFSPDTQEELAVGIHVSDKGMEISLFPVISRSSRLSLMAGGEKEKFLKKLADWSELDELRKGELLSGRMELDNFKF